MEITQVRVFPVEEDKLKAFVSIVFDECFVVSDIKIIQGANGLFVSMPSKRSRNGSFRDIAHPLNNETRRRIEERIIGEYRKVVSDMGGEASAPVRRLDGRADDVDAGAPDAARDTFSPRGFADPPFDHPGS
jgi:stage V sporulation protein G